MAFKDVLFEKQNQLDGCFRKRKQSCVPHMSLDGIIGYLHKNGIINFSYRRSDGYPFAAT